MTTIQHIIDTLPARERETLTTILEGAEVVEAKLPEEWEMELNWEATLTVRRTVRTIGGPVDVQFDVTIDSRDGIATTNPLMEAAWIGTAGSIPAKWEPMDPTEPRGAGDWVADHHALMKRGVIVLGFSL